MASSAPLELDITNKQELQSSSAMRNLGQIALGFYKKENLNEQHSQS
ncbi:hypothetical protein [Actinobacillus equuli]|nr:hypothetical protein [Actinobacillus equuli]WGE86251.1 hypothetical protein NYR87_03335 [Actinobacillus equuli subsp. haemolyticus]